MVSWGFYLLYTLPMPHSPGEKHPEVKKRSCCVGGRVKGRMREERKRKTWRKREEYEWRKKEEGGKKVIES